MGSSDLFAGMKAEYYSPSFSEWIECRIAIVRPDGTLKLEHADGSGTLKESADPSRVRQLMDSVVRSNTGGSQPGKAPPSMPCNRAAGRPSLPPANASASAASAKQSAIRKAPGGSPSAPTISSTGDSTPKASGLRRPSSGGVGAMDASGSKVPGPSRMPSSAPVRSASKGPGGGQMSARGETPRCSVSDAKELGSTINPKPMYVGDRVRLKGSNRTGEVMYIGSAQFSNGDIVIGIKLDEKRSSSDCDGKYKGERYFRCQAGYGIYQTKDEVEVLPPEQADEDIRSLAISPAPDAENFDLDAELDRVSGLQEVKDSLRHARNFIEVQRRRMAVVGDTSARGLHFAFLHGGAGSGTTTVAKLLGGLLVKLDVLSKGHVVEVSRKELLSGCSGGDVEPRVKKVVRAAEGGILVVCDADSLKDPERSDRLGEEAVIALGKHLECTRIASEWPQKFCVVVAGRRGELQKFLSEQPMIASAVFARLEFADLGTPEISRILRRIIEEHKFQLSTDLTDERLEVLIRRRMSRGGGGDVAGGAKNVRLAKAMLEEAVSRQTDRVWAKETLSFTGLTALIEDDFIDRARDQREAAEVALRKLDSIVGLRPVKQMVRSLYAQLLLEQQKRDMGIESRGSSSTLHMVFEGNPGTGKTTVGRVVAELLKALGILRIGHLVEADRSSLVAGYSGQTALKTKSVVESAFGGVLLVDEAYSLAGEDGKDSFGKEALDTLIKLVEDYRTDLVVIIAGYSNEMAKLLDSNPGLRSRFPNVMRFDDYTPEELLEIADQMLLQDYLLMSDAAATRFQGLIRDVSACGDNQNGCRTSGNGRSVRNIIERAKRNQAMRLQTNGIKHTQEELCTLLPQDFDGCSG